MKAVTWCGTRKVHVDDVPDPEMQNVFNLGVGMLAVVARDHGEQALDAVRSVGHDAWIVGEVVDGRGRVRVETR